MVEIFISRSYLATEFFSAATTKRPSGRVQTFTG